MSGFFGDGINLSLRELISLERLGRLTLHKQAGSSILSGSHLSKRLGRGMEFDEVRHYQQGDDIRALDWRVTARTGKPHTKLFREERERPVYILLDLSPSHYFGSQKQLKSVAATQLASILAWSALGEGDRVGGLVFNCDQHIECKPLAGKRGVLRLLNACTTLHQQGLMRRTAPVQPLSQMLFRLRQRAHQGSLICVISDLLNADDACRQQLTLLRRHHRLALWQIYDPLERALPKAHCATLWVSDGVSQSRLEPASSNTREHYQQRAMERQQQIEQHFLSLVHRYQSISCAESLPSQLRIAP